VHDYCYVTFTVILVVSSVLGSYLARISSPEDVFYHIEDELSVERIFFGGFLVMLGARLADGCTSGHGITGMGHLALRSVVAVRAAQTTPSRSHVVPSCLLSCFLFHVILMLGWSTC
jgi:uncharacterized membrane protein YedE/YeeE